MKTTSQLPPQLLGRFFCLNSILLARVGFCQDDFQHLVLNSGLHVVWIYRVWQLENQEHLSGHFPLEHRSSVFLLRRLLPGPEYQATRLG